MKHLESGTVTTDIYIFLYWFLVHGVSLCCFILFHCCFMLFHAVSRCFTALFHAVSLLIHCCFIAVTCCFIAVSRCFITLFHGVSSCFIALFHPVSWPWNRCSGIEPLDGPVCGATMHGIHVRQKSINDWPISVNTVVVSPVFGWKTRIDSWRSPRRRSVQPVQSNIRRVVF